MTYTVNVAESAEKDIQEVSDVIAYDYCDPTAAMRRAGAPSHDDMLDCFANIENAELLKKIVWPIAPRQEPIGGGVYRKKKIVRKGDRLFGR